VSAKEKRFLTHEQVSILADAAGDHGLAIRVLAYTGIRFGELAALRSATLTWSSDDSRSSKASPR